MWEIFFVSHFLHLTAPSGPPGHQGDLACAESYSNKNIKWQPSGRADAGLAVFADSADWWISGLSVFAGTLTGILFRIRFSFTEMRINNVSHGTGAESAFFSDNVKSADANNTHWLIPCFLQLLFNLKETLKIKTIFNEHIYPAPPREKNS